MEILKKIPVWAIVLLLFIIAGMAGFAIADGRRVDFWPPAIHEKNTDEISELKEELKNKESYLSPAEVVALFPKDSQDVSIEKTKQNTLDLIVENENSIKELSDSLQQMQVKITEVKKIDGTFLYKLLIFNYETQCYGATLNFTAGKNRPECLSKEVLASKFLEFLAEIDFYPDDKKNNPATAKEQLLKLQSKYQFNTKGWYGPDVFKAIISEFYSKA
jgi:hypothetical protein